MKTAHAIFRDMIILWNLVGRCNPNFNLENLKGDCNKNIKAPHTRQLLCPNHASGTTMILNFTKTRFM